MISLVVRYPFTLPLATAHVHPCAVSTPQRRSTVTPAPPAAQPLKNRARDLLEAQLLSPLQCERTGGDSSNRSNLLTPLQCGRTDGDSSNRSNLLTPLQCGRTDGDSSSRSNLLTPLQCRRTDGDSSSRSNASHRPITLPLCQFAPLQSRSSPLAAVLPPALAPIALCMP